MSLSSLLLMRAPLLAAIVIVGPGCLAGTGHVALFSDVDTDWPQHNPNFSAHPLQDGNYKWVKSEPSSAALNS